MFGYELEGLRRLDIKPIKCGTSYRLKVCGRTGKMVFIGKPSLPKNMEFIAKQYNVSNDELTKQLSPDYKLDTQYIFKKEKYGERHFYEYIPTSEFYDKLENMLLNQPKVYKSNIALGYTLYDPVNDEEFYFYPNIANTAVYDRPFTVNSRADARKIVSDIRTRELADGLKYPKSGVKLKAISGFLIQIDYRDHALGDSDALVPEFIKKHKYIVNFTKTNNKCVFHCLAYHFSDKKDSRKIQTHVKAAFKKYSYRPP
ncbi:hypothetical protein ON010_g17048 [Phytophthora cinnamomi]|nr:hypothetical protein ON010_g17048 [Phytophthora cinnamomi]